VLPISDDAILVGGDIDPSHGHYVNHLIIGNLGDEEIVLVSCDDGDVLAYHTNVISDVVERIMGRHIHHSPIKDNEPIFASTQPSAERSWDCVIKP
jgi:hypothetical protein